MPRATPSRFQNLLSSVILPYLSLFLLPLSFTAIAFCIAHDYIRSSASSRRLTRFGATEGKGCVMISGGRMSKGLTLARAFKRAGWRVVGVEEEGWGELCPMRFSSAVDAFHLLPPASSSYAKYSARLLSIAKQHSVTLFIPVSGAGTSVEDARAAESLFTETNGRCRTFIQDPETMSDLHDKDSFIALVDRLGLAVPKGRMVVSVDEAMAFLSEERTGPKYVLKCMALDENRGDMTLFPLKGDDEKLGGTRRWLETLKLGITEACPYVLQEFIPGQEWCTHASVIDGRITSFVTSPSNDMLLTYEDATTGVIGRRAEEWTRTLLERLKDNPTSSGQTRRLTGHFSFDLISSTTDGKLYPLECNARVHTAVILLPISQIAACYAEPTSPGILRPKPCTLPRAWVYNDLITRYLPLLLPYRRILALTHPSLPACLDIKPGVRPSEDPLAWRVDPTLVADDWVPFLVLWHVWWPELLLRRWWQGKKWTRLNVSTGRIFEA